MDWVVHYFDRKLNRESISREHPSRDRALRNACDLLRRPEWRRRGRLAFKLDRVYAWRPFCDRKSSAL
jgi:hypothetical protein